MNKATTTTTMKMKKKKKKEKRDVLYEERELYYWIEEVSILSNIFIYMLKCSVHIEMYMDYTYM